MSTTAERREPAVPVAGDDRAVAERDDRAVAERDDRAVGGRDDRAVAAYVERLGNALTDAGMPRLAARVFAQLLADDDGRMTATELTEALAVSPAAVSGAVRYLTHTLMIGKERERGSRRDVYVVQVDAWHDAIMNRNRLVTAMLAGMRAGVAAVGGKQTRAGRRLQLSAELLGFLNDKMAEITEEWHVRRAEIMASWPADPDHT